MPNVPMRVWQKAGVSVNMNIASLGQVQIKFMFRLKDKNWENFRSSI